MTKLPDEKVKMFAPKVRNLTRHSVEEVLVTSKSRDSELRRVGKKEAHCEILLEVRECTSEEDCRIDVLLIPGEYTDEIEREGLDSALTCDDEKLRSVAAMIQALTKKEVKRKRPPIKRLKTSIPRRVPQKADEDVDLDDLNFDFDDDDL